MASFVTSTLIKEIRLRKKLQQSMLLSGIDYTATTLSRIENGRQNPNEDTLLSFIDCMEIPANQLLYPCLESQTIEANIVREQIIYCLDNGEQKVAKDMIAWMEGEEGFDYGINLQFLISCKARIACLQNENPDKIISLTKKGIAITFPEFDEQNFDGEILLFEEVELLHTLACAYRNIGRLQEAIKLLRVVKKGLLTLPEDDFDRERKLIKIMMTLSDFLIEALEFEDALELCEIGKTLSLKWIRDKNLPDFVYNQAYCLFKTKDTALCLELLYQSYFGYMLLCKKEKAREVVKYAAEIFGVSIKTYGAEDAVDTIPTPYYIRS